MQRVCHARGVRARAEGMLPRSFQSPRPRARGPAPGAGRLVRCAGGDCEGERSRLAGAAARRRRARCWLPLPSISRSIAAAATASSSAALRFAACSRAHSAGNLDEASCIAACVGCTCFTATSRCVAGPSSCEKKARRAACFSLGGGSKESSSLLSEQVARHAQLQPSREASARPGPRHTRVHPREQSRGLSATSPCRVRGASPRGAAAPAADGGTAATAAPTAAPTSQQPQSWSPAAAHTTRPPRGCVTPSIRRARTRARRGSHAASSVFNACFRPLEKGRSL